MLYADVGLGRVIEGSAEENNLFLSEFSHCPEVIPCNEPIPPQIPVV
jgi:hypothetical protein